MTSKERVNAVMRGETADRIPVFPLIMRFAAVKSGYTYEQFASDGRVLAESQLKVMEEFDLDVITVCSDAFRLSADLGGEVIFDDVLPPRIEKPIITSMRDLERLSKIDVAQKGSRCADRVLGIEEMVKAAGDTHYVVGWVDFPFAEACSCCGLQNFMIMMMDEPDLSHAILDFLTDNVIDFALAQLEKGAPMIGCGDAATSLVSNDMFREFALPYEKRVVQSIHDKGGLVKTHICGNTTKNMESIVENDSDLFNVDHMVDLKKACDVYSGHGKAVKGNVDPVCILRSSPEEIYEAAKNCVEISKGHKYLLSAGCEITPDTPDENLKAFCRVAN